MSGPEVAEDARQIIAEIAGIKQRTRTNLLSCSWQWLLVWSVVCAGAAVSAFTALAGWYWVAAVPVGMAATLAVSVRAERQVSIRRKAWPYFAVAGGMALANTWVSMVFDVEVVVVGIWVVLGLGFAALAALDRLPAAASVFVALAAASGVAGVAVVDRLALYPILASGFAVTLAGFSIRTKRAMPA